MVGLDARQAILRGVEIAKKLSGVALCVCV